MAKHRMDGRTDGQAAAYFVSGCMYGASVNSKRSKAQQGNAEHESEKWISLACLMLADKVMGEEKLSVAFVAIYSPRCIA